MESCNEREHTGKPNRLLAKNFGQARPFQTAPLIDEATTDSNDESDEHAGLLGMIREEVACPFRARTAGRGCGVHPLRLA